MFKKGDGRKCRNYSSISLFLIAGKAFAWIVLKHMQKAVDTRLR